MLRLKPPQNLLGIVLIGFLPLALFGLLLEPNKYSAIGMQGSVDCDGPLTVLIFTLPAFIVYFLGVMRFLQAAFLKRSIGSCVFAIVCASLCFALLGGIFSAIQEYSSVEYQQTCGKGF